MVAHSWQNPQRLLSPRDLNAVRTQAGQFITAQQLSPQRDLAQAAYRSFV